MSANGSTSIESGAFDDTKGPLTYPTTFLRHLFGEMTLSPQHPSTPTHTCSCRQMCPHCRATRLISRFMLKSNPLLEKMIFNRTTNVLWYRKTVVVMELARLSATMEEGMSLRKGTIPTPIQALPTLNLRLYTISFLHTPLSGCLLVRT